MYNKPRGPRHKQLLRCPKVPVHSIQAPYCLTSAYMEAVGWCMQPLAGQHNTPLLGSQAQLLLRWHLL
jgi:hypothetical protein